MSPIKLKICGMREEPNLREVGALKPDYIGFIFYAGSPRFVGDNFKLTVSLPEVKRVGVFVNEPTPSIIEKSRQLHLDYVQLHGEEPIEQCAELRQNKLKIIKAFHVDGEMDFTVTMPYEQHCDYFLFDTRGNYYGGNARSFDWDILKNYNQRIPFFLSGGIDVSSVKNVKNLKHMNLHAIDVNSGVELRAGVKDTQRVKAIQNILTTL